ncbi:hypothetical protein RHSIM_Rhsim05G0006800 [Rhododendron simsii]|uniref:Copper transport protein n=1 Tax=Rhododendron simsii TaxID=118357 RepID=A0A834LPU0_RHOSS|nr:hypothetical protein RHSIM_Rhsim05G0006800 [Rhododendron simsii]
MHMTMYWGTDLTLLFDWWTTDSWLTYSLSLLACFLFSLLYQFLKSLRILLFKPTSAAAAAADLPSQPSSIGVPLLSKSRGGGRKHSLRRLANAVLFGVNAAIGCGDLVSESNDAAVENSCACS